MSKKERKEQVRSSRVLKSIRKLMEREGECDQVVLDELMVGVGRLYVQYSRRFLPAEIAPGATTGSLPGEFGLLPNWEKRWQRISARIHATCD
jgi:hypothetical protein